MITPTKIPLSSGSDSERQLKGFLRERIRSLKQGLRPIYETRIVKWRQAYEAQPAQLVRSFPFENASNLVVPVIAIHADTLLARIMSAVVKSRPTWVVATLGDTIGSGLDDSRGILEELLQYVAFEPSELDLYNTYHEFFGEAIRYGTSTIKTPFVEHKEEVATGMSGNAPSFTERTVYSGPRPSKIPFQDFLIDPTCSTVEEADFLAHVVHLKKYQLKERAFKGIYDKKAVEKILPSPDRTSPSFVDKQKQEDAGARVESGYGFQEWDIFECHFKYNWNGHYTRCIVWYHESTDTIVRAFFNYYPACIFTSARLFYRDDMFHGYGFAEILGPFQEEISVIHNQRRDNQTVNMAVWRVDPNSKLHKGYKIYPSAMIPADKDEIEPLRMGDVSNMSIDEENLALSLAERRSGVTPPQQGAGAGSFNKRGVYTAMGTLSLMQDSNSRTDLNITDMRMAHTRIGRLLCDMYSEFGTGDRSRYFGAKGKILEQALNLYKMKRLALPIYAATASVNREVEKQNDIMLANIAKQHYQMISTILEKLNPILQQVLRLGLLNIWKKQWTPRICSKKLSFGTFRWRKLIDWFLIYRKNRLLPHNRAEAVQAPPVGAPQPGVPPAALGSPQGGGSSVSGPGIPAGAPGMGGGLVQ